MKPCENLIVKPPLSKEEGKKKKKDKGQRTGHSAHNTSIFIHTQSVAKHLNQGRNISIYTEQMATTGDSQTYWTSWGRREEKGEHVLMGGTTCNCLPQQ